MAARAAFFARGQIHPPRRRPANPRNPGRASKHLYATPASDYWIIFQPDGSGGMPWSFPGWYSKLRNGVYIMACVEEASNGTLGVICFNKQTMARSALRLPRRRQWPEPERDRRPRPPCRQVRPEQVHRPQVVKEQPMGTSMKNRRHFFLRGGAALGAGAAAVAGANSTSSATEPADKPLHESLADREAIRQLHVAFMSRMESQAYESAAELFAAQAQLQLDDVSATGAIAISQVLAEQYRQQQATSLHSAYRPNSSQPQDVLEVGADRRTATAIYHVDVRITSPLRGDSTLVQMARLQGQMAMQRWETTCIEASYVKSRGEWKVASLRCLAS